jgi:cytochrome c biogenesis protein CcmG/thiol:disulfide interchange protein DsbE
VNRSVLAIGLLLTLPLVGLLFAGLGKDPRKVESPLVGRSAPAFTLKRVDGGGEVSLESLRGRPVVLNFWATWCVPCYDEHPVLLQGARVLGKDVEFLGVVYEDEEDRVNGFLAQHGNAFPSLMDDAGKTAIAYGVAGVPETFFIDKTGKVVEKHVGPLNARALHALIEKTVGGAGARAGQ